MAILREGLVYLFDSIFQVESVAGKPCVGGHIEVYLAGTNTRYITYQDWDGTVNPFKIPLRNDGRAVILVSPVNHYDAYIYDSYGNMVCSRLNIVPGGVGGDVHLDGAAVTNIKNTDNTLDVILNSTSGTVNDYTINSNHKPLGVETPLKFVQDDEEATIIGLDENAIPSAVAPIVGPIVESAISSISGQFVYSAGDYIDITNNVISVTGDVGKTYSAGDNIAITEDNVISGKDWTGEIASAVSSKLDTSAFSAVSGDFLQSGDLNNYYTKEETNNYVNSAVEYSTSGKLDASAYHEYSAGNNINITDYTISGRDWSGEILSATSGKQDTLSAGNNIQISGNVISVTGELGKIYSGENHVVVDNVNDKIGLDETAQNAIDAFNGEFDLSAGNNIAFRLEGSTVYIDGTEPYTPTYTPIIEDL